jgi:hypothetical protein
MICTARILLMTQPAHVLQLELNGQTRVLVHRTIVAGWTGRDREALEKHIRELEELGVARPATTPIFYRVSASRLTTQPVIEVCDLSSSGEVEFVLLKHGGQLWIGIGSDHTDRQVEAYGITVSKQMCDKPIGVKFWDYEDVKAHWDKLLLRSFISENEQRVVYQEGNVAAMLSPEDLLSHWSSPFEDGSLMFCGTLPARGGIRPSSRFEFELVDPVAGRKLSHGYDIVALPVLG